MALQVRRGTNAERIAITPLEGELVFTTDTKQLYVGDGATAGGITSIANTIDSLLADNTPQLGGELDLNGNNIVGTGNININGTITATGNINLGDGAGDDVISLNGVLSGNLLPQTDTTWNIGAPTFQFKEAWISQLNVENQLNVGRIMGDLIADDSTVVFDSSTGLVTAGQLTGTLPAGVIPAAMTSNITGDLTGNVTGTLDGDVTGSIFADDSTLLIDGINGTITGKIDTTTAINVSVDGENISLLETFTNTTGGANDIIANTHRGTIASPTNITMGDGVVDLVARGFQGTTYHPATFIRFRSDNDGVPSGDMDNAAVGIPGSILFTVFDNSGVQNLPGTFELNQTGLLVGSSSNPNNDQLRVGGNISSSGTITPGIYADAAARDAAITSPTAGMMVFVTDITKFQGYTGSAWADLN
jgi:hypothetical protein